MVDLEKLRIGDQSYFAQIIREHNRVVAAVCRGYGESEDDVKDLVQEVWILAYQKRRKYHGRGSFGAWVNRLAVNHCIDVYRRRRAETRGLEAFVTRGGVEAIHGIQGRPGQELIKEEAVQALWRAMDSLPEREREAIVLRLIECRSPAEVSREMRIDKASVRSNISRGIRRLRRKMGGKT